MRLILSRKGFDSSAGGVASPIFEDGSMLSLPIPERHSGTSYRELAWNGRSVGDVVEALTRGKRPGTHHAHLDPDLIAEMRPRRRGWRPSFGQCSAAQTVLAKCGVGPGDLFLFFGWFRRVREERGVLSYERGAPDVHALFGWLQVGEVLAPAGGGMPAWAQDHPHVVGAQRTNNVLYVASERLTLDGVKCALPGAGVFPRYCEALRLTAPGATRSRWRVPSWLAPREGVAPLGYHGDPKRWQVEGGELFLDAASRGQEFVLDGEGYPAALPWVLGLLEECGEAAGRVG